MKIITRIVQEKEFKDLDENRTREIVWGGHYLVSIHDIDENNVELSVFVGEEIYDPIPFPDVIKHVTEFICKKLEGNLIYAGEEYVLDDSFKEEDQPKVYPGPRNEGIWMWKKPN